MLLGPEDSRFSNSNADILLSKYKAHNAAVKALVPKERLLIYRIGDGWEPICNFLGKPIPDVPFPHKNRLASGVEDLKNNPRYIGSLRRQIISWGLRIFMLICKFKVVLYLLVIYNSGCTVILRNPSLLPLCFQQGALQFSLVDNFLLTCGYILFIVYLFKIAWLKTLNSKETIKINSADNIFVVRFFGKTLKSINFFWLQAHAESLKSKDF